jgi:hypothetical protein
MEYVDKGELLAAAIALGDAGSNEAIEGPALTYNYDQ